ncbi:MAG: hypothetical protein JO199_07270 [Candidatus Eremiobacteraeota bacterium]|nr:hypothetical protein [Candidatus Eremiobacteraeota bacterium]
MIAIRRLRLAAFAFSAVLANAACSATAPSFAPNIVAHDVGAASLPRAAQVRVPLAVRKGSYRIDIAVGGGPRRTVVFDTGSTGLHFLSLDVGKNVRVTKDHFTPYGYESGTIYKGYIAYGDIDLGNGVVIKNARFGYITSVSCEKTIPWCPGASGISGAQAKGAYGVLGVRLNGGQQITSPLNYLAAPLNGGFAVTQHALYLGLPAAFRKTFHPVRLMKEPYVNVDGMQAWSTVVNVRWSVDGALLTGRPMGTDFDTGTTIVKFHGPDSMLPPGDVGKGGNLVRGHTVEASVPGAFDYSFVSGGIPGRNYVGVILPASPFANSGLNGFEHLDIMFDPVNGLMGFRPPSK